MTEKKVERTAEEKAIRFLKTMGLMISKWGMSLYFTLLYVTVWNWFLSDKLFVVGYWEMFLGVIIIRYIFGTHIGNFTNMRLDKAIGEEKASGKLVNLFIVATYRTIFFGVLYVVHLMISYYS